MSRRVPELSVSASLGWWEETSGSFGKVVYELPRWLWKLRLGLRPL